MSTGADWLDSARKLMDALRPAPETAPAGPAPAAASSSVSGSTSAR